MSTPEPRPGCVARRHGDMSAYSCYMCRCPDAREAWRLYRKRLREGRVQPAHVDSTGTARRLQALAAIGWSLDALTPHLGCSVGALQSRRMARWPTVTRASAERVARVYDELSMTAGPSSRTRDVAARNGWVPPLAWDDDIDDPAATPNLGTRAARTTADVAEEARHLLRFGTSLREIALRLDVSESWIRQLLGGGKRAAA